MRAFPHLCKPNADSEILAHKNTSDDCIEAVLVGPGPTPVKGRSRPVRAMGGRSAKTSNGRKITGMAPNTKHCQTLRSGTLRIGLKFGNVNIQCTIEAQRRLSIPHRVIFVPDCFRTHLESETAVLDPETGVSDSETAIWGSETTVSDSAFVPSYP